VDAYVGQFAKLPVPPIQRTPIQLGGEPAEVLEGVPGRGGSRDVFALHNGTLFHLMFMPSVKDFVKAKADVDELYQSVMASFSFLPGAIGKSIGTVQLLEPAPNAQIDGSPTLRWAKVPDAAQYKLVIMDAATTQIAFDLVFTDTSEIVLVIPPPCHGNGLCSGS
jgi:hypothetical protein